MAPNVFFEDIPFVDCEYLQLPSCASLVAIVQLSIPWTITGLFNSNGLKAAHFTIKVEISAESVISIWGYLDRWFIQNLTGRR